MVKKHHHRLPATSTPTGISTPDEKMSHGVSGHVVQQTGRALVDIGQLASSRQCVTSFPVNRSALWSPYLDVRKIGKLLHHLQAYNFHTRITNKSFILATKEFSVN